mmetsp:Transcript_61986/g.121753  ORF Transcript_61986/g.121753 Transcript_61986/m.121753 type:complete len:209 (-) Transcript_61986:163-789(-)
MRRRRWAFTSSAASASTGIRSSCSACTACLCRSARCPCSAASSKACRSSLSLRKCDRWAHSLFAPRMSNRPSVDTLRPPPIPDDDDEEENEGFDAPLMCATANSCGGEEKWSEPAPSAAASSAANSPCFRAASPWSKKQPKCVAAPFALLTCVTDHFCLPASHDTPTCLKELEVEDDPLAFAEEPVPPPLPPFAVSAPVRAFVDSDSE